MRICLLLGPPCSGKSTLGNGLSKELGLPHIMASSLLQSIDKRHICGDLGARSVDVIMTRLRETDCSRGFILDNFPRNAAQAQLLDQQLQSTFNQGVSCVFDFEVSVKVLEERAGNRFVDANTGLPVEKPANVGLDDPAKATEHAPVEYSANETGVRRGDDAPDLFQPRLQRYANNIHDLRAHYGNERCVALNGELEKQQVIADAKREVQRQRLKTQLTVDTLAGKQLRLDVSNVSSVGELKELIEIGEGVPVKEQKLLDSTRELANFEFIPQSNITLVRQHVAAGVFEDLIGSLRDGEDAIAAVRLEISPFINAVKSSQNWVETTDREECGCCTVTNRYVGQDPPKPQICSQLVEDILHRIIASREKLAGVQKERMRRHHDQAVQKLERAIQEMDAWSSFWTRFCFPCCMDTCPEQIDIAEVEALCADVLQKAQGTRSDLTSFTMKAATKTTKTLCVRHEPPPMEPGSP